MYILQEIQTNGSSVALVPAQTYTDKNEAESAYHLALSSAAISTVEIHTVVLFDERGMVWLSQTYEHPKEV